MKEKSSKLIFKETLKKELKPLGIKANQIESNINKRFARQLKDGTVQYRLFEQVTIKANDYCQALIIKNYVKDLKNKIMTNPYEYYIDVTIIYKSSLGDFRESMNA